MFVRFEPMVMAQAFSVTHGAYINNLRYCEYPYKNIHTPMLSMLHSVVEGDAILGESMKITTFRLNSILSYLQRRGFVAQNYEECINTIRGINAVDSPTYCLSFDDFTKNLWTNENIRNIFNKYNAKPTLVYIIEGKDLIGDEPPIKAPTREEYQVIKNSGWSIIPHGYSAYTDKTSYAQFVKGFKLTKDKWVEWYGECPIAYNPHSMEIKDYQYNLLKQMGYGFITRWALAIVITP